jgi:hypothetical protein
VLVYGDAIMTRDYYNRRTGQAGERPRLTLAEAAGQIASAYRFIDQRDYLQRSFGYYCVDARDVPGRDGNDIRESLYLATGVKITEHLATGIANLDEVALFTVVEFVFDHVARPLEGTGWFHGFSNCGSHYDSTDPRNFDEATARAGWRAKVNGILKFYADGFELSAQGEVMRLAADGVSALVSSPLPEATKPADAEKVTHALQTFLRGRSTREARKQAVRSLFDVLEFHRPAVKAMLKKDEDELFNIANNFSIRHHRETQKNDYDDAWLPGCST